MVSTKILSSTTVAYTYIPQEKIIVEFRAVAITAISQYRAIDEHNRRGMQQPQQPRYFLFFCRKVTPFSFYT